MERLVRMVGVSKIYPRVQKSRERLLAFISLLFGREPAQGAQVLKDINLEVVRGQSLGIIGENGAGKSTLLKVLTGVVQPTHGRVMVHGNIAAMLELGAGFEPDFSGMDNIRMKASLMGLSNQELEERLGDILEFADIGEYIHEPVKHYSSGMVVRLGFAVITAWQERVLRLAGLSRAPIWRRIGGLVAINALLAIGLGGLLAWQAHLGGWIAGWLLAAVFRPRYGRVPNF